jgi:hypothetical protein
LSTHLHNNFSFWAHTYIRISHFEHTFTSKFLILSTHLHHNFSFWAHIYIRISHFEHTYVSRIYTVQVRTCYRDVACEDDSQFSIFLNLRKMKSAIFMEFSYQIVLKKSLYIAILQVYEKCRKGFTFFHSIMIAPLW